MTWLLLPPLAAILAVPCDARGVAAARLVVATFAVAALSVAVGEAAIPAVEAFGAAGPGNPLFLSITAGLVLGAMCPFPRATRLSAVALVPLLACVIWAIRGALHLPGLALGTVFGALPFLVGWVAPRRAPRAASGHVHRPTWVALGVTLLAAGLAMLEPMAIALLAPAVPIAWRIGAGGHEHLSARRLVLPVVATLGAAALGWFAFTIAGDPLARLVSFFSAEPVSPAAERWLGVLALALVAAMQAPWPLHRFGPGVLLAPAASLLAWRMSASVAPDMLAGWQPVVGMVLVPSAIVAAWRGHWPTALGSAALVVAFRPEPLAMVGILLASAGAVGLAIDGATRNLVAPDRVTFSGTNWAALLAGAGMAATAGALLHHEVVLASVLAWGLSSAAARVVRAAAIPADPSS